MQVDPVAQRLPDYLRVVSSPMDLGTIHARLAPGGRGAWGGWLGLWFDKSAHHLCPLFLNVPSVCSPALPRPPMNDAAPPPPPPPPHSGVSEGWGMVPYKSTDAVAADLRLVFDNCRAYNASGSAVM